MGSSQPQGGAANAPGTPGAPQSAFTPHQGDLLPKPAAPAVEPARAESGGESASGPN
jgi:hypothetical protein